MECERPGNLMSASFSDTGQVVLNNGPLPPGSSLTTRYLEGARLKSLTILSRRGDGRYETEGARIKGQLSLRARDHAIPMHSADLYACSQFQFSLVPEPGSRQTRMLRSIFRLAAYQRGPPQPYQDPRRSRRTLLAQYQRCRIHDGTRWHTTAHNGTLRLWHSALLRLESTTTAPAAHGFIPWRRTAAQSIGGTGLGWRRVRSGHGRTCFSAQGRSVVY